MSCRHFLVDRSWTLFLDRDGVINQRIPGDYVRLPEEFVFETMALDAIKVLSGIFGKLVIVTNQQGIGKGLMTEKQLNQVHDFMMKEISKAGGRIDAIFYSPHLESENHIMRKPNVGMALAARKRFPEIRFKRSVMVGDSRSDMVFGKRLGMKTVLISDKHLKANDIHLVDLRFKSLYEFSEFLSTTAKN